MVVPESKKVKLHLRQAAHSKAKMASPRGQQGPEPTQMGCPSQRRFSITGRPLPNYWKDMSDGLWHRTLATGWSSAMWPIPVQHCMKATDIATHLANLMMQLTSSHLVRTQNHQQPHLAVQHCIQAEVILGGNKQAQTGSVSLMAHAK